MMPTRTHIQDRLSNVKKDGLYHVFYTAYNEDFKLRGKTIQSVMQATGKNLENLETVKRFFVCLRWKTV